MKEPRPAAITCAVRETSKGDRICAANAARNSGTRAASGGFHGVVGMRSEGSDGMVILLIDPCRSLCNVH
jgi:hypothetical protein